MTEQKIDDKNLENVVEDLLQSPVNSHEAQQIQQAKNDRRHKDSLNHEGDHFNNVKQRKLQQ